MTTADMPIINLDPNAAEQRAMTDVYRIAEASYQYASDDYVARRSDGVRPQQLSIKWEALSFRFEDNPDVDPVFTRSVNVTDRNGSPATWGDPTNPEPTPKDSLPMQISKYFAKCGVTIGTDPHILDGMIFLAERRKLKGGPMEIDTIVPLQKLDDNWDGQVRMVRGREQGTAGNPMAAAIPATTGPSDHEALTALANAMNGKTADALVNCALENPVVQSNGNVLAMAAQGTPAVEALKEYGTWDAAGVFTRA